MLGKAHYVNLEAGLLTGDTSTADLDQIFSRLAGDAGRNVLVVHFHGGLNSRDDALQDGERLFPLYRDAGAYPVFFAWESSVPELLRNQVLAAFDEPLFKGLLDRLEQFAVSRLGGTPLRGGDIAGADSLRQAMEGIRAGEDVGRHLDATQRRAVFAMRTAERRRFESELANDEGLVREISAIANTLGGGNEPARTTRGTGALEGRRQTRLATHVQDILRGTVSGDRTSRIEPIAALIAIGALPLARAFSRFVAGRDHGLRATMMEEIFGSLYLNSWGGIYHLAKRHIDASFGDDPGRCGGTAFLVRLKRLRDAGVRPRIVLVGHSAGSVYVCSFLVHARALLPDVKFDVVLLTPAVTFARFREMLDKCGDSVNAIRSYSLDDELERRDPFVPALGAVAGSEALSRAASVAVGAVYPRSTLYFTSGLLEYGDSDGGDMPIVGMQRYHDRRDIYIGSDFDRVRKYFEARPGSLCWITRDMQVGAIGHSGFFFNPVISGYLRSIVGGGISPA